MSDAQKLVLEVNNIEVVYERSIQVLAGLSLQVRRGDIVALLGSNGAGKSTTLKAVSRLIGLEKGEVIAGNILFDGKDIVALKPHELVRKGLFHVMEGRRVFEDLTVEENLIAARFALSGRGKRHTGFDQVYTYFPRLYERRGSLAGYLSGGEQQMLAIGRALVAEPKLILFDEPSLGLAPKLVDEIFRIIECINKQEHVSMLLVEQNAAIALSVADYGYIMENGKVMIDGSAEKLMADGDVQEFYLGVGVNGEARKSYRDVKHYKRRKRWLS